MGNYKDRQGNLDWILTELKKQSFRKEFFYRALTDSISRRILGWLTSTDDDLIISQETLADHLNETRQKIRTRLQLLSRFGLIRVTWININQKLRGRSKIEINPIIRHIVNERVSLIQKKKYISHLIDMGQRRTEDYDEHVQGFRYDTRFGSLEKESAIEQTIERELLSHLDHSDDEKKRKQQDNLEWKERGDIFIDGASKLWRDGMINKGFGSAIASWSGQVNNLGPSDRTQRNELIKLFERYGGRVTALAWALFCGAITEIDNNGNPSFTLSRPHAQYVTIDRKPTQFAKHFNAILKDPDFIMMATKEWASSYEALKKYFLGSIDIFPRDGSSDEMLAGIEFQEIDKN